MVLAQQFQQLVEVSQSSSTHCIGTLETGDISSNWYLFLRINENFCLWQ